MARPPKHPQLQPAIQEALNKGEMNLTLHARQRMRQRRILQVDLVVVLRTGHRVETRDRFEPGLNAWSYVIEGLTQDGRALRVVIAWDPILTVVTVISLERVGHED